MIGDILREQNLGKLPSQAVLDWFLERGVPALKLAKTAAGDYHFVRLDEVVFLPAGSFEFLRHKPKGECERACTVVVQDQTGDPLDIVAWQATTGRVATWLKAASLMGEDELFAPREDDGLRVHQDPLAWFRNERRGVVILNKKRAAPLLREVQPLIAASVSHGEELDRLLRLPAPRILVSTQSEIREAA